MSDLVTRLSVLAEDDGDRYPAHVKKLAEAAASRIAALEVQLAERAGGVNEDALRALAQAYDREDAAQRGEPDPWNLDDPGDIGDSDTWVSERLACARAAAEAFLSTLSRTGAVKVKALTWSDHPAGGEQALGAGLGLYRVHANGDDWYLVPDHMGNGGKAAAQADYERRILSALEPAEPATDAEPERKWPAFVYDSEAEPNMRPHPTPSEARLREAVERYEATAKPCRWMWGRQLRRSSSNRSAHEWRLSLLHRQNEGSTDDESGADAVYGYPRSTQGGQR